MTTGDEILIRWSARVVVILFFASWFAILKRDSNRGFSWYRIVWPIGAVALLVHAIIAMSLAHDGSHAEALRHTAERTRELLRISIGWGLYWNYAMTAWWLADAGWLVLSPGTYRSRARVWNVVMLGFFAFMTFNATVVFEQGTARWLGIVGFALLGLWLIARRTGKQLTSASSTR